MIGVLFLTDIALLLRLHICLSFSSLLIMFHRHISLILLSEKN